MAIARLESEVLLAELASKVKSIEPLAAPVRRLNHTLRGIRSLPVRVRVA